MTSRIDFVVSDCEDLACHVGSTFVVDLFLQQDCTDLPIDLTGYSAEISIVETVVDVETVIETITGVIDNPTDGSIHFELSAADTADLDIGRYWYYLTLTIGTTVYREAHGTFEVAK